jgi:tRNA-specific 2-thiouridylase
MSRTRSWSSPSFKIRRAAATRRVRSTAEPVAARLGLEAGEPRVIFDAPEYGVSPGQACVLYAAEDPNRVLGGGFIEQALK